MRLTPPSVAEGAVSRVSFGKLSSRCFEIVWSTDLSKYLKVILGPAPVCRDGQRGTRGLPGVDREEREAH